MLATPSFAQPQREEVDARVYQWRGEDQIAGIVDAASGPKFYDHDGRGRLVRERRPDAVVERAMDAVGNVYRSRTGSDRRYGPGGRLEMADGVRYEHDEDGNQTLKSGPDGDWHYRWNGHGMLREVERPDGIRVAFEYDPFARRTVKRTLSATGTIDREVDFVWDGHNVIHELDSERGLVSWQWEPESFTPIAKEHAGRRWTIASDHLGTPTEMYDDLCQLAWKMQLDVFGVPSFEAGSAEDCPWRWPGQYEDGGTGLFYNRWRYYDTSSGRYFAEDPLSLYGGPAPYAYADDVAREYDPLGLSVADVLAAAMASAGRPLLPGQTAHHIIQRNGGLDAARAEAVLRRSNPSWTRDSASNGAALWGTQDSQILAGTPHGHPGRGVPGARPPGYHGGGVHGAAAQRRIADILERAERLGMDPERVLRQLGERMETGRFRCR
jgi:RHS repeat-associated protein